ncbi:hypothetical protein [Mycolicibacterium llatzerense]|uniref:hypothetical protein n=1 Tax=Mycolicibacterium llatzerense TaxID=280871 RepID=UPI0021B68302|nr:hypothetical protein [Mycolicibacterium llatzerense]
MRESLTSKVRDRRTRWAPSLKLLWRIAFAMAGAEDRGREIRLHWGPIEFRTLAEKASASSQAAGTLSLEDRCDQIWEMSPDDTARNIQRLTADGMLTRGAPPNTQPPPPALGFDERPKVALLHLLQRRKLKGGGEPPHSLGPQVEAAEGYRVNRPVWAGRRRLPHQTSALSGPVRRGGGWVFPYAGTDAHDPYVLGERRSFSGSPSIRIAGRRVLELTGLGVDDIDAVDVYSCFPSAVQVAARELGLALDDPQRPLTVTGGLTFAGGPWNNYVSHSIATMAERLAANPGQVGLITANGGYLTKHSFGVYGTRPPTHEFRWEDVQSEVDAEPTVVAENEWSGTGTVETWTTPVTREGAPEKIFVAVRTPSGSRALAVITDPSQADASTREDLAGAKVTVKPDGTAGLE